MTDLTNDPWQGLEGQIAFCDNCSTKIWVYWYNPKKYHQKSEINKKMSLCAPCYFDR